MHPHTTQYIAPLQYRRSREEAKALLLGLLTLQPRTQFVLVTDAYIHVEVTSPLFRFVDDVEFVFDDQHPIIHMRSASRSGYWDFNVNRRRLERLRTQFDR